MRQGPVNYDELGVTYIRIPKTASRSVYHAFFRRRSASYGSPKYKSFAVVRDPITRFQSCLAMFTAAGRFAISGLTADEMLQRLETDDFSSSRHYRILKHHCMPMTSPEFQLDKADWVIKYEALADAWPGLASFIGVETPEMPHINKRQVAVELTQVQKDRVYAHFKLDFKTFGYPHGPR